jgi:hypothetical protein
MQTKLIPIFPLQQGTRVVDTNCSRSLCPDGISDLLPLQQLLPSQPNYAFSRVTADIRTVQSLSRRDEYTFTSSGDGSSTGAITCVAGTVLILVSIAARTAIVVWGKIRRKNKKNKMRRTMHRALKTALARRERTLFGDKGVRLRWMDEIRCVFGPQELGEIQPVEMSWGYRGLNYPMLRVVVGLRMAELEAWCTN